MLFQLAHHQITHQATLKMGCQSGDCHLKYHLMYGLMCSLYPPWCYCKDYFSPFPFHVNRTPVQNEVFYISRLIVQRQKSDTEVPDHVILQGKRCMFYNDGSGVSSPVALPLTCIDRCIREERLIRLTSQRSCNV